MNPEVVFALVGATAVGKTDLGEELADALDAEVVCADSRQVFRELDLGTGKPASQVLARRKHHLFDALELEDRPSAGWYARAASAAISDLRARGRRPLLVGGAGLYLRALQQGLSPEPALDPGARASLRTSHAAAPVAELHARLAALDPESAARLRPADRQRISRALEVVELSGRPVGWWHAQPARPPIVAEWRVLELRAPPAELSRRIERRSAWMFAHGLIEEAQGLVERGREPALRRLRAVGYDEALDLLAGLRTREEVERRTSERTRQLAKRQRTWFRHQIAAEVLDVPAGGSFDVREALRRLDPR